MHDPLFIVGNYMGAVVASHLATQRNDIHGLILQAPMLRLDKAVPGYLESSSPFLAKHLPRRSIEAGVQKALHHVGVTLQQTDIKPLITSLRIPVLILASPADSVSPFNDFGDLQTGSVTFSKVAKRSHSGMAVIASSKPRQSANGS